MFHLHRTCVFFTSKQNNFILNETNVFYQNNFKILMKFGKLLQEILLSAVQRCLYTSFILNLWLFVSDVTWTPI